MPRHVRSDLGKPLFLACAMRCAPGLSSRNAQGVSPHVALGTSPSVPDEFRKLAEKDL
jgi:hypothetical protein